MRSSDALAAALIGLSACDREEALEAGADVLQDVGPVKEIDVFVNGFHYASGDLERQEEANHYCHRRSDVLIQCVLYDGTGPDANMIGTEHILSREAFDALPEDEKALWHPHTYEVKSGALIAPGLPLVAEHELMEELVGTYGKTWHGWHPHTYEVKSGALIAPGLPLVAEHELMEALVGTYGKTWHVRQPGGDEQPLGTPTLMKGFTADGQLDPALLQDRDQRFGVDSDERARNRADIPDPGFDPIVLEEPQVCEPTPLHPDED